MDATFCQVYFTKCQIEYFDGGASACGAAAMVGCYTQVPRNATNLKLHLPAVGGNLKLRGGALGHLFRQKRHFAQFFIAFVKFYGILFLYKTIFRFLRQ